jgi:hypothetical protein
MGAAFANTTALAIWPILFWAAWCGGARRAWMIVLVLVGAAFITLYSYGLMLVPQPGALSLRGQGLATTGHVLKMADYLVGYMGLPWTRAPAFAIPGRVLGALLFGAGLWAAIWRGVVKPGARLERLAVALILFSLASALLAAVGRVDIDADVRVPVRYSVFMTPLHVGLLWLSLPYLSRQWAIARQRHLVQSVMMVAGLLLLVQQVAAGETAAATTRSMRATIERFRAGEYDPGMTRVVFSDLAQARRAVEAIRRAGLYLDAR